MTSWWETTKQGSVFIQYLTKHVCQHACDVQADFEKRVNPNDKAQVSLLEEMRAHVKKVWCRPYKLMLSHSERK